MFCGLLVAACGESEETKAVCSHAAEFESSLVATSFALDALASTSPRQLQSTLSVLSGSLSIISEISPSAIKADVAKTRRAYDELSVSFQNVGWNGQIALTDANVQNSISNLSRNDNVESLESIRNFIEQQCSVEIGQYVNALPYGDQPVTNSSVNVDPLPEINYGVDNEDTAVRSFAYFIAQQRGIAITQVQADCLGKRMIAITQSDPTLSDDMYEASLNMSFSECDIIIK